RKKETGQTRRKPAQSREIEPEYAIRLYSPCADLSCETTPLPLAYEIIRQKTSHQSVRGRSALPSARTPGHLEILWASSAHLGHWRIAAASIRVTISVRQLDTNIHVAADSRLKQRGVGCGHVGDTGAGNVVLVGKVAAFDEQRQLIGAPARSGTHQRVTGGF